MLTTSTATKETATTFVPPEPSETSHQETGSALPATLLARPASTILPTAPAASTEWVTSRLLPSLNPASSAALMELTSKTESAKSATSSVPPASDRPPTVSPVLPTRFSTEEDAGESALPFLFRKLE